MSSISIIAIKGNHLDRQSEIFELFRYIDLNNDRQFDTWDKSATFLYDNYLALTQKDIALRGLWTDNGWTIICDPEMIDSANDSRMETLSKKLNAEVLTFFIQTTSGSFGFSKYNPNKQRSFSSTDGQILENSGAPLTEEQGLNINQNVFIDDIVQLAHKFGVDMEVKNAVTAFLVKELGYNDELKEEIAKFNQLYPQAGKATNQTGKPWWKIW